ncbi:sugar transferase [Paracoccus sp. 11-3]|uniref:Sugar transferase n=2 Tax=Paracoccus amoyensis TaxID=2760093 RepID=A0A926JAB6_9RHOB|nr:sugar transferase [Paracoccus amoyensis]
MAFETHTAALVHASDSKPKKSSNPRLYRRMFKRPVDILLVVLASPVFVPVVLVLALLVWMRDRRNPFYSQLRIGRGGNSYRMWKLRTMVVDADAHLNAYLESNPEARDEWERTQKLRHDPRITVFGRILRATSLDELPQLWNVATGDMSLVGPRPMLPEQEAMYAGDGYYRLRPGITGFWQIAGRNRTTFAARAWYDDQYERELSMSRDVVILMQTVRVVLTRTGC